METKEKVGPVGKQVAENVKEFRKQAGGMTVRDLSAKVTELGRKILPSGITKIEKGERRVDADDLAALATALNVSPPRLLMDGRLAVKKLEEYRESGYLQPITDAVFNALTRDRLDPVWIEYQLELAISILPALQELLGKWETLTPDEKSAAITRQAKGDDDGERQAQT
jgi:transcriptional regulator with XRE-family HTH domain